MVFFTGREGHEPLVTVVVLLVLLGVIIIGLLDDRRRRLWKEFNLDFPPFFLTYKAAIKEGMQKVVDGRLSRLAKEFLDSCAFQENWLRQWREGLPAYWTEEVVRNNDFFVRRRVAETKKAFWRAWGMARRAGFAVSRSVHHYQYPNPW